MKRSGNQNYLTYLILSKQSEDARSLLDLSPRDGAEDGLLVVDVVDAAVDVAVLAAREIFEGDVGGTEETAFVLFNH